MRNTIAAAALAAAFAPTLATAQSAPAGSPVAGNFSLVSDYRFRGLTQTFEEPAIQGGFDYAHPSGLYVGNWNSSIADTFYAGSPLEMDFYAGYKPTFGEVALDVGVLYYYYPGSNLPGVGRIDNTELYGGVAWKWFSLKYFHAVSDFFGAPDTKDSNYIDLSASYPFGSGWGVTGHIGRQKVKNVPGADYTDYRIGVSKDFGGWAFGLAYVDTDAEEAAYTYTSGGGKSIHVGDSTLVFSVSKTF